MIRGTFASPKRAPSGSIRTSACDPTADHPGQWLTHCHNAYHGESTMMTVVSYVDQPRSSSEVVPAP